MAEQDLLVLLNAPSKSFVDRLFLKAFTCRRESESGGLDEFIEAVAGALSISSGDASQVSPFSFLFSPSCSHCMYVCACACVFVFFFFCFFNASPFS